MMARTTLTTLALVLAAGGALPSTPEPSPPTSVAPLDVVLLLDNSGSMRQNDPRFLTRNAVTSFAARLPADARLAVISFDQNVHVLLDLTAPGGADLPTQAAAALQRLDYGGQRTDIPRGVERALYALREHGRPEASRVIVLLTDGIVDLGDPATDLERARWLRDDLAAEARQSQVRIFGIAFTDTADYQLLQSLARTTVGAYFRAATADELESSLEHMRAKLSEPPPPRPTPEPKAGVAAPSEASQQRWARLARDWRVWTVTGAGLTLLFIVAIIAVFILFRRRPAEAAKPALAVPMPAATLRDLGGYSQAEVHALKQTVHRIGRVAGLNDLILPYDSITRQHALIEFRDGCFRLRDLRSTNGSFVNGERLDETERILRHKDIIAFHRCEFEFVIDELWEEPGTTYMERAGV
jgi:Mg-chelatase subunit ChlD